MTLPPSVLAAFKAMDKTQQKSFRKEYSQRAKSTLMGYLAWLLLGWHYLYLGRVGVQFAFWFTGGFLIIGWCVDLFRVSGMVRKFNDDLARELMIQHKALAN